MSGEAVSIKGTKNGLVIIYNPDLDPEDIKSNLKIKMEKSNGFFRGAKFTFYNSNTNKPTHLINELEGICLEYGLIPSGEVSWPSAQKTEDPATQKRKSQVIPLRQQNLHSGEEQATLIFRTVRSGQRVFSAQSLVILGDVNPGAEVLSENSVYILGSCKGNVHAGCSGNIMAEVSAFKLQPSILRIGTIYAEDADLENQGKPRSARVSRGKIVYDRFSNLPE
ncbi:MAG: septum site-determining protein MinC [Bacillota bacterium]